jgi:signal transduction histidine kinase
MHPARARPSVCGVFEEVPWERKGKPPRVVHALRAFGIIGVLAITSVASSVDPEPSLHGDGLGVTIGLALFIGGVLASFRRHEMPRGHRAAALAAVAVGGALLAYFQPAGASAGAVYYVFALAELRLERRGATVLAVFAITSQVLALALAGGDAAGRIAAVVFATLPWYFVMRLMRELRHRHAQAEDLIVELHDSREAEAQAAALGERARLARDMHDVLAHSLSALALQLEGARLLAAERGADHEVVAALERSHRLAAGGLDEARRAISALRGDELPGPERLEALADAFCEHSAAECTVTVAGEPRELESEARLAIYRTAQEALTNVRRHSAASRVEMRLDYANDGVTLAVADHGPGAPVAVGASSGYGLTGMRERAELLGGRLSAGPTEDGFRVELWLP